MAIIGDTADPNSALRIHIEFFTRKSLNILKSVYMF